MKTMAQLIARVLDSGRHRRDRGGQKDVKELCDRFPIY
jgi:hypothetical protein